MGLRNSKRHTWRVTTTIRNRDGVETDTTQLFNFPFEPTPLRLRIAAKSLVSSDIVGLQYVRHEAHKVN